MWRSMRDKQMAERYTSTVVIAAAVICAVRLAREDISPW
jgi:hypothetical protein